MIMIDHIWQKKKTFAGTPMVCQEDYGFKYRGTLSETKGGIECQAWNLDYPHNTNKIGSKAYKDFL